MTTARQILRQEFGSARNFMTPTVLRIGKAHPAVAFEISAGTFGGKRLYAVTLAGHDGAGQTYRASNEWSRCFTNEATGLAACAAWVAGVRRVLKGRDARSIATWLTSLKPADFGLTVEG
jgi:hypothetical protein